MAALITAGRYTRQPQQPVPIDARWRAKRLRVAYVPNSLNPFDLAGTQHGADTSTTSTLSLGTPGRVWDFGAGSSTSRILLPSNSIVGTGGVTWLAVVRISSLAAARTIACGNASASGSLQWRISTGGMQEMVSSGVSVLATDTVALSTGTWYALACTISSQTPVIRSTFARDGRITSNPVTSTVATTNGVGVIGDRHSASSQPFAGQIALFACFDSLMSEAELVELTANPWGIFARRSAGPFLFNEPAAGGPAAVTCTGLASTEAFGTSVFNNLAAVGLTGIATAEAFGDTALTRTSLAAVSCTGIASAEAIGSASVAWRSQIDLTGIGSAEAFGTHAVVGSGHVFPTGIASAEAFGTAAVSFRAAFSCTGIASSEAFGSHEFTKDGAPPSSGGWRRLAIGLSIGL